MEQIFLPFDLRYLLSYGHKSMSHSSDSYSSAIFDANLLVRVVQEIALSPRGGILYCGKVSSLRPCYNVLTHV